MKRLSWPGRGCKIPGFHHQKQHPLPAPSPVGGAPLDGCHPPPVDARFPAASSIITILLVMGLRNVHHHVHFRQPSPRLVLSKSGRKLWPPTPHFDLSLSNVYSYSPKWNFLVGAGAELLLLPRDTQNNISSLPHWKFKAANGSSIAFYRKILCSLDLSTRRQFRWIKSLSWERTFFYTSISRFTWEIL